MNRLKGSSADNPWTLDPRGKLVLTNDLKKEVRAAKKGKENAAAKRGKDNAPAPERQIIFKGPKSTILPHRRKSDPAPAASRSAAGSGASRSGTSICEARLEATSAPVAMDKRRASTGQTDRSSSPVTLDPPNVANNAKTPLRPVKYKPDLGRPGRRYPRDEALTIEELYVDEHCPHPFDSNALKPHHTCGLCDKIKSHPVTYQCGHSDCYVCIRLRLETDWTCPHCKAEIQAKPFRHYGEEQSLEADYPEWIDQSRVWYNWYGLVFPRGPRLP